MKYSVYAKASGAFRTFAPAANDPFIAADEAVVATDDAVQPDTHDWSPSLKAWTPRLFPEAKLLMQIDMAASVMRQGLLTTVPGQADIYRRKQAEVDKMGSLGGTLTAIQIALNLMTAAQQEATYPLLWVEKEAMGYATLSLAYDNVAKAIAVANLQLNAIEKARRKTKAAIRSAATLTAKNSIAAAVAWPA